MLNYYKVSLKDNPVLTYIYRAQCDLLSVSMQVQPQYTLKTKIATLFEVAKW